MNATLRQIRSFVVVARRASFTQAAKLLHVSQPALTVQIRELEKALGVQLFDRNTRTVRLTRIGRELAPQLERLQDELDAVVAHTQGLAAGRHGTVRLACLPSFAASVLPSAINAFRAKHPQITFVLRDAVWSRMVAMVRAEEVDFGVGDMVQNEADLEFVPLMQERMKVVFPAAHAIAKARKVTVPVLATYPLVLTDPDTSARRMLEAAFSAAGCIPIRAAEVTYLSTAVAMVRAGFGIAILPAAAIEWRAHPGLRVRPIDDAAFVRWIGFIKKTGRSLPPPSDAFAQALAAAWREPAK